MRNFLRKTVLFLLVVVVLDILFGFVMGNILDNTQKGDWGRNNYIFDEVKADAIILGSSRAIHHYNPVVISDSLGMSCYNCGEDGMGILLMYARYCAIRERNIPKVVIYEVLPEYDLQAERDNQKYLKFLRPYSDIPAIDSLICSISSTEKYKLLSQMYRYNSVFVDIVAQRFSKASETAATYTYSPLDKNMNYEPVAASYGSHITCDSMKLAYMEELIKQCRNDETYLIFTASPIYRPASDAPFTPLKQLCEKYGVPFVKHYCDTTFCNKRVFFADASHLNKTGAETFSEVAAGEIKSIIYK